MIFFYCVARCCPLCNKDVADLIPFDECVALVVAVVVWADILKLIYTAHAAQCVFALEADMKQCKPARSTATHMDGMPAAAARLRGMAPHHPC